MTATVASARIDSAGIVQTVLARLQHIVGALRQASVDTRADLARTESERLRERRLARDTAEARGMAARYAQSAPSFAADIRAAIDRHEYRDPLGR